MIRTTGFLAAALLGAGAAQALVIENFESGAFGPGWVGTGGTVSAPGINLGGSSNYAGNTNGNWYWRNDPGSYIGPNSIIRVTFASAPGDTGLSVGVMIGWGPSTTSFSSFGRSGFKNHENGVVTTLTNTVYTDGLTNNLTPGQKYIQEVAFGPSIVAGLPNPLNTISADTYTTTGLNHGASGYFGIYSTRKFDNVEFFNPGTPPIPEPASWMLLIAGCGAVGFAARRRRVPEA